MKLSHIFLMSFCFLIHSLAFGSEIPQYAQKMHMGVATCASGVCHGSIRPRSATNVLQNEYVTWSRLDPHSNAYEVLLNEDSKRIARNLGLSNAHEADVCLDCHADNVPEERRGPKFQVADGVGCESCHGGSESYISSHTDPDQSHKQNIEDGLYPTDDVVARANLCFSCHMGDENKIASHKIMGAGHPRLSIELDTFTALEPPHYLVDADYKERKWAEDSVVVWAAGQVQAARQTVMLIAEHLNNSDNRFPELSLFDCHACHHPMSDIKWEQKKSVSLPPGSVRLNDAGLSMIFPIVEVLMPEESKKFARLSKNLHLASSKTLGLASPLKDLSVFLDGLEEKLDLIPERSKDVMLEILKMGQEGKFRDYVAAEQAVMAVDLLLQANGARGRSEAWLNQLYATVENQDHYNPLAFQKAMRGSAGI